MKASDLIRGLRQIILDKRLGDPEIEVLMSGRTHPHEITALVSNKHGTKLYIKIDDSVKPNFRSAMRGMKL
jgi:hypothetical protein